MCKKSPSVVYVYKKINTTKKSDLIAELEDSPLTEREFTFICCIAKGYNITQLSDKFNLSPARISQWKREVCEKIHAFDIAIYAKR